MATAATASAQWRQTARIMHFVSQGKELLPPEGTPLSPEAAGLVAQLVLDATRCPDIFSYFEILALPTISMLCRSNYCWYFDMICLFAFGTYKDYKAIQETLPPLSDEHLSKLKMLSVLTAIESNQVLHLDKLMEELDMPSIENLHEFLTQFCNRLGITAEIKEPQTGQAGTFQVNMVPKIRAAWVPEESLEVFLRGATTVLTDPNSGLLSNGLVTQVMFPLDPSDLSQWKLQVISLARFLTG